MKTPSAILMGSKPGSVVALSIMIERGWHVKYVVVSRKISHPWISGPTLEEYASSKGIKVVTQLQLPRREKTDFIVSYMFRYKVKPDVIAMAGRAAVNFHAAPLPEFGGWAFYSVAILENSPEYGCSCHYMDDGFDTGPLLKVNRFPIDASKETAVSLEKKAQENMIGLFVDFCDIAESCEELPRIEQDRNRMRYMQDEDFMKLKEIPLDADNETIDRYARAFWYPPYECAYVKLNEEKVGVIPKLAKEQIAALLHRNDFESLKNAARIYRGETPS